MSNIILPTIVLIIVIYGIKKNIDIYDTFVSGAKESFDMVFKLFPNLLAMILGINIFIKSGFLNFTFILLKPILGPYIDLIPLCIMRPISGSSGIALLNNIFTIHNVDSFIGKMASVIQGSTDTTLYILTLYFGSVNIKKTRYALKVGLLADLFGIISAIIISYILFK